MSKMLNVLQEIFFKNRRTKGNGGPGKAATLLYIFLILLENITKKNMFVGDGKIPSLDMGYQS